MKANPGEKMRITTLIGVVAKIYSAFIIRSLRDLGDLRREKEEKKNRKKHIKGGTRTWNKHTGSNSRY